MTGPVSGQVAQFNELVPVGTPVVFWPGARTGKGTVTVTRSAAWLLGGHTPVVQVEGYAGGIALTHVLPIPDQRRPAMRPKRIYRAVATYADGTTVTKHYLTKESRDRWATNRLRGFEEDPGDGRYDEGRPAIPPAVSVHVSDSLPVEFGDETILTGAYEDNLRRLLDTGKTTLGVVTIDFTGSVEDIL